MPPRFLVIALLGLAVLAGVLWISKHAAHRRNLTPAEKSRALAALRTHTQDAVVRWTCGGANGTVLCSVLTRAGSRCDDYSAWWTRASPAIHVRVVARGTAC
jgi:hypothetical protein